MQMFDCLWHHCALPVRVKAKGGQVISGFSWGWSHAGSLNPSCDYFLGSGMHNWNGHTQQLAESPRLFCDCEAIRKGSRKGWVEATRTASIYNTSKPKAILHSWRDCRDQQHHPALGNCRDGDSHHIPIQLIYLSCAENRWIWRITMNYHKPNQNHSSCYICINQGSTGETELHGLHTIPLTNHIIVTWHHHLLTYVAPLSHHIIITPNHRHATPSSH